MADESGGRDGASDGAPSSFTLGSDVDRSSGPNWQGLLKWSLSHSDGTAPPHQLSEEERKWFMEAMQAQTVDVIKRMKEISMVLNMPLEALDAHGVTTEDVEVLLEELQEHVESIDMANDLHAIGGLVPLINYLRDPNASIRARASEVLSTMVQNNPKSQQLVMDTKGLEPLLSNFMADPDTTVRAKSLGAISSLIRNNKPGVTAFRLANGYAGLKDALVSDNLKLQRKGLQVLQYLLHQNPSDCNVAVHLGFLRLLTSLTNNSDADIRQAALQNLLELARNGEVDGKICEDSQLKQALQSQIDKIQAMKTEDLRAVKEERALVDALWQSCFNEPSSLRQTGLVLLPGEDELPPDVASRVFEPALRAGTEPRQPNGQSESCAETTTEKPPLLLVGSASHNDDAG